MTTSKTVSGPVADQPTALTNLAVLRGTLVNEPTRRELPSGSIVVQFDLSTRVLDGTRTSTMSSPIAWAGPSDAASSALVVGSEYLVVGSVRRRFFRVGGATQSRTEVVAERVISVRRHKQIHAALDEVVSRLATR